MWTRLWRWLRRPAADSLGTRGEAAAARYLRHKGYRIVAQQLREGHGELDLVAIDRQVVVFVEVKTRRSNHAGHPAEAIDRDKQRRLTRAALAFLRAHRLLEQPARFDVVAVHWPPDARRPVIEHLINAFEPPGHGQFFA
ncbi:MAG: YraN family protein [Pirellulaceae bacterium]